MTFPELFSTALGVPLNPGSERCFWCGASCDQSQAVRVTDTFWDWDAVAHPRSRWQCAGCSECLNEKRTLAGRDKPQKTRNWSWHVTDSVATPLMAKSSLGEVRSHCLNPPSQRWGCAIAESGQKHIMYRTPVNEPGADICAVQLELLTVRYTSDQLRECIINCAVLASVVGTPPLKGALTAQHACQLLTAGIDPQMVEDWNAVWNAPLWRLAAFLCPLKKDCHAYLAETDSRGVPPATGRTERRTGQRSLF